jgi:hypothetical protein
VLLLQNGASKSSTVNRGQQQRRSLLQADASAAQAAASALGNVTSAVNDMADMLALGATPADGYLAAGDAGAWVSAANTVGRALNALPLQVGSTAFGVTSAIDKATNAQLQFYGQFVGFCSTVDDSGVETEQPCPAGPVTVGAQFYEDAALFADVRTAAGLPLIANASSLAGLAPASGVVVLAVSGSNNLDASLPCSGACGVRIQLPLTGAAAEVASTAAAAANPAASRRRLHQLVLNATAQLACLRMEAGQTVFAGYPADPTYAVTEVVAASVNATNGLATCTVTRSGT